MVEKQDIKSVDEFPEARAEIFLRGPVGQLECLTDVPDKDEERPVTAIICHPHPVHGAPAHD